MTRRQIGLLAAAAIAWTAARGQLERGAEVTGFRMPNHDEEGRLQSQVFGDRARVVADDLIEIRNLRMETFSAEAVELTIQAPHCRFDRRRGIAASAGPVRVARPDMVITGRGFRAWTDGSRFQIFSEARVELRGARPPGLALPTAGDAP